MSWDADPAVDRDEPSSADLRLGWGMLLESLLAVCCMYVLRVVFSNLCSRRPQAITGCGCHGDISLNNLMHDVSAETGNPVGIVNDFDLATWVDHPTTNNDRTGTIPFMAIDLLDGGLDDRTPRLYRHDLESFVWVLAYITVASIAYKDRTIKISPPHNVDTWFKDHDQADRRTHILSKRLFHSEYGSTQRVSGRYYHYTSIIQQMTRYWSDFHRSLRARSYRAQPLLPDPSIFQEERILSEPEYEDPADLLKLFITKVETLLRADGVGEGFAEVKTLLLEVIETPTAAVDAV